MGDLDELTFEALERYFNVLEKTGYVNEKDVNKLLLLMFIQEVLNEYAYYITEEDYNLINKILVCLFGSSCLIPFMQYQKMAQPIDNYILNTPIRITEDNIIRHTQSEEERLVNN